MLSLLERKHWGVLGELRYQAEQYVESHQLSLYHESTPWKRYLRRNRHALAVAAGLMVVISAGFFWRTSTKIDLLQQQIKEGDLLIQTELQRVLPKTSDSDLKSLLMELKEDIEKRKAYIEKSKKFESREYQNLSFLKTVSSLLSEGAPFQVVVDKHVVDRALDVVLDRGAYWHVVVSPCGLADVHPQRGQIVLPSVVTAAGIVQTDPGPHPSARCRSVHRVVRRAKLLCSQAVSHCSQTFRGLCLEAAGCGGKN